MDERSASDGATALHTAAKFGATSTAQHSRPRLTLKSPLSRLKPVCDKNPQAAALARRGLLGAHGRARPDAAARGRRPRRARGRRRAREAKNPAQGTQHSVTYKKRHKERNSI